MLSRRGSNAGSGRTATKEEVEKRRRKREREKRRREQTELEERKAVVLQRIWRAWYARRNYRVRVIVWRQVQSELMKARRQSALLLQNAWWVRKHRMRARDIQRVWDRRHLAAILIQCLARRWRARLERRRREEQRRLAMTVVLQAAWRGYCARKISARLRCEWDECALVQRGEATGRAAIARGEGQLRAAVVAELVRSEWYVSRGAERRERSLARAVEAARDVSSKIAVAPPVRRLPAPQRRQPQAPKQGLSAEHLQHWLQWFRVLHLGDPYDARAERLLLREATTRQAAEQTRRRFIEATALRFAELPRPGRRPVPGAGTALDGALQRLLASPRRKAERRSTPQPCPPQVRQQPQPSVWPALPYGPPSSVLPPLPPLPPTAALGPSAPRPPRRQPPDPPPPRLPDVHAAAAAPAAGRHGRAPTPPPRSRKSRVDLASLVERPAVLY
eukprot:TRINITY_DN15378_c0_g1_i2.p1 TRINITY_DN15378_c0_g1~~TRINITY_DN15378_c0_g1_i2.p1  ORF type:complete len:448 (+),score=154.91 TRINITY_DN15378_c0_g1_i2:152-1495(+)